MKLLVTDAKTRHSEQSEESSLKTPMRPFAPLRVTRGETHGDGRGRLMVTRGVQKYLILYFYAIIAYKIM
jgi:hypothetical protein